MRLRASSPSPPADSRGAALILALLIVATVTGLAVAFAGDFQLSAARGENRWHGAQAREYLYAAEDFAAFALISDDDKEKDSLNEPWATGLPRTPLEDGSGWIEGAIEDAQSRFNLNSLAVRADNQGEPANCKKLYTPAQRRFVRLLQTFELEEGPVPLELAIRITNSVIDWLDEDSNETDIEFGRGEESSYYQQLDPPYRAADRLMVTASELRLIKDMTAELYELLEPYVVALPTATDINVNTAPQRILRTINQCSNLEPLVELDAQTMIEDRGEEGFGTIEDFWQSTIPQQFPQNEMRREGLTVKSSHFIMHANAEIGRQRRHLTTLMERDEDANDPKVTFLQRSDRIWCSISLGNCGQGQSEEEESADLDEGKEDF